MALFTLIKMNCPHNICVKQIKSVFTFPSLSTPAVWPDATRTLSGWRVRLQETRDKAFRDRQSQEYRDVTPDNRTLTSGRSPCVCGSDVVFGCWCDRERWRRRWSTPPRLSAGSTGWPDSPAHGNRSWHHRVKVTFDTNRWFLKETVSLNKYKFFWTLSIKKRIIIHHKT